MKKKTCPYCDQVMKMPGYCGFCRRLVSHPREQEINYYLNERHPAVEEDCLYHGSLREETRGEAQHTDKTQQNASNRSAVNSASGNSQKGWASVESRPDQRNRQESPKQSSAQTASMDQNSHMPAGQMRPAASVRKPGNGKKTNPISIMILIYIVVAAVLALIKNFNGLERSAENVHMPELAVEETSVMLNDYERTDEQVKAEGTACNAYGHLDVDSDTVISALQAEMEQAGYAMEEYYRQSSNLEQGDYRYYNTSYGFDLTEDTEWSGMLQLYFDTATDQMHGMQLIVDNDKIRTAAEGVLVSMKDLGLLAAETDTGALLNSLIDGAMEYDMSLSEQDVLDLGMRVDEEGEDRTYTLMIYGKGYLTDAKNEI